MKKIGYLLLAIASVACNKNETITGNFAMAPRILLDSETGIYTVKTGRELTLAPRIENGEGAVYAWYLDGNIIGRERELTVKWEEIGVYYLAFCVRTSAGAAEEELKVEVTELTPPVISLPIPPGGLKVVAGTDHVLAPTFRHDDLEGFRIEWLRDGACVSTAKSYTFRETEPGTYPLTVRASNIDGQSVRDIVVEVVATRPYAVAFPTPSHFRTSTDRHTFVGRTVYLKPSLAYFDHPRFSWSVDGESIPCTDAIYRFTPTSSGDYTICVTVTEGESESDADADAQPRLRPFAQTASSCTATVVVHCTSRTENDLLRAKRANSLATQNRVYEWTPAPGQFIGATDGGGGMTGNETTLEAANAWAETRLAAQRFVSLGGFGGYIVVGFDHSILKSDAPYDFAIAGNAFDSSNEPGIVWVMQDIDGNGLPDDEWYELRGSETGKEETLSDYAVTYFRPAGKGMDVEWIDSEGCSGHIDYLGQLYRQDCYYPAWIETDSYTLRGTRLSSRNRLDPTTGYWNNRPYDWGYADNSGSDDLRKGDSHDGSGQSNGFRIAHAIYPDGTPVELQYIDFIKVQVGVNAQSGALGELSTEVLGFRDYSMTNL